MVDNNYEYPIKPDELRSRWRTMEQMAPYVALEGEDESAVRATGKLSSKNQLTLPVAMLRLLGLKAGDELELVVTGGDRIVMSKRLSGEQLVRSLRGSMADVPEWRTKETIDEWVRGERDSWDRAWDNDEETNS